jgi:deoxyadenosine/deoxycytidine kinase
MIDYLSVVGLLAAGKTTMVKGIQAASDAQMVEERFKENPWLEMFYEQPKKYAWVAQIHFLRSRWAQLEAAPRFVVEDGSPWADRVFARVQHKLGNFGFGDEEEASASASSADADDVAAEPSVNDMLMAEYEGIFELLRAAHADKVPSAILVLDVTPETAHKRMVARDRDMEKAVPISYLRALKEQYEVFVAEMAEVTAVYRLDYEEWRDGATVWEALKAAHTPDKTGVFTLTL